MGKHKKVYHSDKKKDFYVALTQDEIDWVQQEGLGDLIRALIDKHIMSYRKARQLMSGLHVDQDGAVTLRGLLCLYAKILENKRIWTGKEFKEIGT